MSDIFYDKNKDGFSRFVLSHPLSICYKVTNKCNLYCKHCIANGSTSNDIGPTFDDIKKALNIFKKSGIIRVDFTGGEPYVRKDIDQILEYAVKLGLEVIITTNGLLLTDENIKVLKKNKIFTQISLDGSKKVNDKLRGKGSYEAAIKSIKLLIKNEIPTRINCTLQQKNVNEILKMIKISESLRLDNLYFILVGAQGRAKKYQKDICLLREQEISAIKKIQNYANKGNLNIKILDYKKYNCILVEPNGDFISQSWDEENNKLVGNIYKDNLNKLWKKSGAFNHISHLLQYLRYPIE